jgi:predicted Zn-dependent protease
MDRPYFNAQMAPNGWTEVWSGLLLRAETEDQLAFVLGHEISHFAENHSILAWRSLKSRATTAAVLGTLLMAGANVGAASAGGQVRTYSVSTPGGLFYLVALAGYFSFTREEESQADELGFQRAVAAGYDPAAAPRLWRNLNAETAASDFPKVREREANAGLFDTHPLTKDRITALDALAAKAPVGRAEDRRAYRAIIRPRLAAWIKDDLRRRDFGESLALIDRLEAEGEDLGVLEFCRGEAFRLRRGDGDLARARDAYAKAVANADAPPEAWRNLGDYDLQAGDRAGAGSAYRTYLERAPGAQDRWLVEASLKKLDGAGP